MKNMNKSLRNGLLSCFLVMSLVFGISASPAFAIHGDDASANSGMSGQPDGGSSQNPDDSGTQPDGDADAVIPDDGDDAGHDAGDAQGDGESDQAEEPEKPFNPVDIITNIPQVFGDEVAAVVDNATSLLDVDRSNLPKKSYDKILFSGKKSWKDAEGSATDQPVDAEGNPIEHVTIRVQGFVDWDDDGKIGASDKEITRSQYTAAGEFGEPKYEHGELGSISYNCDLNGDGAADEKDRYFDANRNGEIEWRRSEYAIVAPYQVYDRNVYRWSWSYKTDALEKYFYDYEQVVDADGNGLGTLTFKLDESGQPVRHRIFYSVTELPVEGYDSTKAPGGGEFTAADGSPAFTEHADGGTDNKVVDFVNAPEGLVDKTGQIVIDKTFTGPIYATGSQGDYNTGNTATVVFHIVGQTYENDDLSGTPTTVFDGYRAMNFHGDGGRTQTLVVDGLPVGAWYTVTEVAFDGQGYVQVGEPPAPFKLEADAGSADSDAAVPGDAADGDAAAGEDDGAAADGDSDAGDGAAKPSVSATHTVTFANASTGDETPNQGWVNQYTATDGGFTVTQIQRTERLQ